MRTIPIIVLSCLLSGCTPKISQELLDVAFQADGAKAIRIYTRAIAIDSLQTESYWRRGSEYYKMHQYARAIADFNHGIELDSSFNDGYLFYGRGLVKEALADYRGAIQDYTIGIRLCHRTQPATPLENLFFFRGRTWLKLGDTLNASIDTDSALRYWPHFPRARYQKARLAVLRGDYEAALPDYLNKGYGNPLTPEDAQNVEFTEDVFYYGLLKFKLGESGYCDYWQAASQYSYSKAYHYVTRYCDK